MVGNYAARTAAGLGALMDAPVTLAELFALRDRRIGTAASEPEPGGYL